jgi:hypothetical protein
LDILFLDFLLIKSSVSSVLEKISSSVSNIPHFGVSRRLE